MIKQSFGCSSVPTSNGVDRNRQLLFPVASLNEVPIRVTRSFHSHVALGECFDSHSSVPLATTNSVASIAFPMSPTVQRCVYAYAYTCNTGLDNPSSIYALRYSPSFSDLSRQRD